MDIAASLNGTATKYAKEIMMMPFLKLEDELQGAITFRENIANEALLPHFDADAEMRPHDGTLNYQTNVTKLGSRKIKVYVGDVVFKENAEALRDTFLVDEIDNQSNQHPLNMQIFGSVLGSVGEKLVDNLFLAERDDAGTTTADLFNGFDTIAATELAANKISVANKNYVNLSGTDVDATNAIDKLKAFYAGWTPQLKKAAGVCVNINETFKTFINDNIRADDPYAFASKTFDEVVAMIVGWRSDVRIVTHVGKEGSVWIQACTPKIMIAGTTKRKDLGTIRAREIENPWETQFAMKGCFGTEYANLNGKLICFGKLSFD